MENEKKGKNKRKIVIIVIIIFILLLVLIKLYFEFKAERTRLEEFRRIESQRIESLQIENMRSVIDSLCSVYPDACDDFEKFANIGSLMVYADSLQRRQEFISLIDSLCQADSANCEKYKRILNIDELRRFLEEEMLRKARENEIPDSINTAAGVKKKTGYFLLTTKVYEIHAIRKFSTV